MLTSCFPAGPDLHSGALDGYAYVDGAPLRDAEISMEQIGDDGRVVSLFKTTRTDEDGRFWLDMETTPGPFLLTARGGSSRDVATGEYIVLEPGYELRSAILWDEPGPVQVAVISPLTTVGESLGRGYVERGDEDSYWDTVDSVYQHLSTHVQAHIVLDAPVWEADPLEPATLTAGMRHALVLSGLSFLARDVSQKSGLPVAEFNALTLTGLLEEDAVDELHRLDGVGPSGAIELGECSPACMLGPNTLRAHLGRVLLGQFFDSDADVLDIDPAQAQPMLEFMAANVDTTLFGDAPVEPLDPL